MSRAGEVFGFLGANGAGKTTAIRMLTACSRRPPARRASPDYDVRPQAEQIKRAHRLHEPALLALRGSDRPGEHHALRRHLRPHRSRRSRERMDGCSSRARTSGRAATRWSASSRSAGSRSSRSRSPAARPRSCSSTSRRRRRPDHPPAVLGADLRGGGAGHDGVRHDALHGRGGVLRPHLDHGGRPHRGARDAGGAEGASSSARSIDDCSCGWRARRAAA